MVTITSRIILTLLVLVGQGCADEIPPVEQIEFQLIGVGSGGAGAARPYLVESAVNGSIVVSVGVVDKVPLLIDSSGVVKRTLGRVGGGPGEMQRPMRVFNWHDSLLVQDLAADGLLLFSPQGDYVRQVGLGLAVRPALGQALLFHLDTIILSATIGNVESFGQPLHQLDSFGAARLSWGEEDRSFDRTVPGSGVRILARASDSTFWAAEVNRLVLDLWTVDGEHVRTLKLDRQWFGEPSDVAGPVNAFRPVPRVASIAVGRCGDLVIVSAHPREDWQPATRGGGEGRFLDASEYSDFIYQRLEVVDAQTGELIAQAVRRDSLISGFTSDGTPFGFVADEGGNQVVVWWKMLYDRNCADT